MNLLAFGLVPVTAIKLGKWLSLKVNIQPRRCGRLPSADRRLFAALSARALAPHQAQIAQFWRAAVIAQALRKSGYPHTVGAVTAELAKLERERSIIGRFAADHLQKPDGGREPFSFGNRPALVMMTSYLFPVVQHWRGLSVMIAGTTSVADVSASELPPKTVPAALAESWAMSARRP